MEKKQSSNEFYVLIYNISKAKNIGTLIRSACAFGVKQIFVLGTDKKIMKKFFGSQGTVQKVEFKFFENLTVLKEHCSQNSIHFCGIEIGNEAKPVHKFEFKGNTLFVLGNEGIGMNDKQKELCKDNLVYIPQYSDKTASLNVSIAASIVFHHYALWAGYKEADVNEEKYVVHPKGNNHQNQEESNEKDIKSENHIVLDGYDL